MTKNSPGSGLEALFPTLVFVVHGGPLEAKSALLAASLAEYYLPGKILCRIIEPEDHWGRVSDDTRSLLADLGVDCVASRNQIDPTYPHGNKINALNGVNGPAVFLDSDILLLCPFSWHYMLNCDAALKPADLDTFDQGGGSWAKVWGTFGMNTPPKTYRATLSQDAMRPYFNAGFVSVRDGHSFAKMWLDTCRTIDSNPQIKNKRPWLDQIGLPVTFGRLGWKVHSLPDAFNYPSHLAEISTAAPYFAHYHWPSAILKDARLLFAVSRLTKRHPVLRSILGRYNEWDAIVQALRYLR